MQLLHKASSQFGRVLILLNQNWGKEKQMKQMKTLIYGNDTVAAQQKLII